MVYLRICDYMNDKYVVIKSDKKQLFFIVQIIAISIMLIIGGVALFNKDFKPYFYLMLSINMLVLIVNNYLFLHKNHMYFIYAAFAIYTFIIFLQGLKVF